MSENMASINERINPHGWSPHDPVLRWIPGRAAETLKLESKHDQLSAGYTGECDYSDPYGVWGDDGTSDMLDRPMTDAESGERKRNGEMTMAKMMKCAAAAAAAVEAAKAEAEKYGLLKARDDGEPRCLFETHNSECRVMIVNVERYAAAFRAAGFTEQHTIDGPTFVFKPGRMAEAAAIVERGKKSDERRKMNKLSILKIDELDLEGVDFSYREIGDADAVATFSPSAVSDVDSLARHKIIEHACELFGLTREETDDGEILMFPGGFKRAVVVEEHLEFRHVQYYYMGQRCDEEEVLEVFDTLADAKEALYSRSVDVAGGELDDEAIDYGSDGYRIEIRPVLVREVYGVADIDEAEVYEIDIYD